MENLYNISLKFPKGMLGHAIKALIQDEKVPQIPSRNYDPDYDFGTISFLTHYKFTV
jgi:hypothetical protein